MRWCQMDMDLISSGSHGGKCREVAIDSRVPHQMVGTSPNTPPSIASSLRDSHGWAAAILLYLHRSHPSIHHLFTSSFRGSPVPNYEAEVVVSIGGGVLIYLLTNFNSRVA